MPGGIEQQIFYLRVHFIMNEISEQKEKDEYERATDQFERGALNYTNIFIQSKLIIFNVLCY